MDNGWKKQLLLAGAPLAAAAAGLYLILPGRAGEKKRAPFEKRYFAHRGLFLKDQSVPENSLPAFARAVEAGYGIELDVQLTKDGEVVVFHDDDLKRGCGVEKDLKELTLAELKELRLFGTEEKIPLFSEVLDLVAGKVPLIVELKSAGPKNIELAQKTTLLLQGYDGIYCVESFDPRIVRWYRKFAPWILRGQLAGSVASYGEGVSRAGAVILSNCLTNFAGRPEFISYEVAKKPFAVRAAELLGAMRVCWTSHDIRDTEGNDTVIFEHYLPPVYFAPEGGEGPAE